MKDLIERFFKMAENEVFDSFARLPRAEVFKDFIFIPGTRDQRILLVGHADTVFDGPPQGVNWRGNFASAGHKYTLITGPAYIGPKAVTPPPAPKIEPVTTTNIPAAAAAAAAQNPDPKETVIVAAAENAEEEKEETQGKKKGKKKGKKAAEESIEDATKSFDWDSKLQQAFVVVGKKRMTINEYRAHVEAVNKESNSSKSTAVQQSHNRGTNYNSQYNHYNGGGYSKGRGSYNSYSSRGLGADDRVGIAMIWLMRNSGHSILITSGEERGGVGAKAAARTIQDRVAEHQFAVEIDRMWDQEMVFYSVSTPEFEKYMQEVSGFRIEMGSYTDIADVCKAAGICGVNLAAGYWGQHTAQETFSYDAWLRTLRVVRGLCYGEKGELPKFELKKYEPPKETKKSSPQQPSTTTNTNTGGSSEARGPVVQNNFPLLNNQPMVTKKDGQPSPYKDGERFPERAIRTPEGTGVAVVTTTIDPKTHVAKTERNVVSGGDTLFPEGSLPIKQALADATNAAKHDLGAAAVGADEGSEVGSDNEVAPILTAQGLDVPLH